MNGDIYQENILDHYKNPRNKGRIENPTYKASDLNPFCGDKLEITLKVKAGKIQDICFDGQGCAISIASASILTEIVKGKDLQQVRNMTKQDLLEELGIELSAIRIKCALLSLKVLKLAAYKEVIEI